MSRYLFILLAGTIVNALNLDYLDPTKLQTKSPPSVQQSAAAAIIAKYMSNVNVEVNPILFKDNKDVFSLRTTKGQLRIRASTGVAAVWGFNYYLKKYCKSQIAWQTQRVAIPKPLPDVDEVVVASDRFRYYQNVCTVSYSFVWWDASSDWKKHVEWMALNGINLALAPIAQEAAWARIYRNLGMTQDEIDEHFTGPAFLSWLRMGNMRGWGGPLVQSWHERQRNIQDFVVDMMLKLGIVPVFPAFNGHVPVAFKRLYPNTTFHTVDPWNKFSDEYCCGLFVDPCENLFEEIGSMFMRAITEGTGTGHIYSADPFNEITVTNWSNEFVEDTASSIYSVMSRNDQDAVWLVQNWMFVHDPVLWPVGRVKSFLNAVPNGRMLVLDLQSEQWPQYFLYDMYFGQPFIWCMLHNFGGTLGMFGSIPTINRDVYVARDRDHSTMIGIGLTPEGINQNYVVYDFMLETGWRKNPVENLDLWVEEYARRRYGCYNTTSAWKSLLKSVYSFDGLNRIRGKYVVTRRPSLKLKPWAWYQSRDLFDAFKDFAFISTSECYSHGFYHDLVDVTRQALQYRAEQFYVSMVNNRNSNVWAFKLTINQFLDVMGDMETILATNSDFLMYTWLTKARSLGKTDKEKYFYELNARNQITLWGPNGEISDYACKQWAEVFHYYYRPRWTMFLAAALDASVRNERFDERSTQSIVKTNVEERFMNIQINNLPKNDARTIALKLYKKWAYVPDLADLPIQVIKPSSGRRTTLADISEDGEVTNDPPTATMITTKAV
ncbi:hypothetical protein ABMA28_003433 [Loxostege sticticalis]|uniref:Alpha-N-acetylglucosaminidase n=1 Tax=Loxostege sticticalis TaxID=481309 RepID=A0ABD0SW36_LOXSC